MEGRNGNLHLIMEFPMTQLQVRAIEKARRELQRAKNELKVHRTSETRYRGIPTISSIVSNDNAADATSVTLIYRGQTYQK